MVQPSGGESRSLAGQVPAGEPWGSAVPLALAVDLHRREVGLLSSLLPFPWVGHVASLMVLGPLRSWSWRSWGKGLGCQAGGVVL